MTQDCKTAPMAHPLELIPLFRRWPHSRWRNLLYTVIWSSGLGVVLTAFEMLLWRDRAPVLDHLLPMLLMSNLIGMTIHGWSVWVNRILDGWPRRATGVARMVYSMVMMAVSVVFGVTVVNWLWRGINPLTLLSSTGTMVVLVLIAAGVALLLNLVRRAADRRVDEARQQELLAASARMLAEARLKALQAQIEPHFLYNTLANVVSLIGPRPAQAQHMLERFIDYLRASLAASRGEQATLASETKLIAAYLDVLAVRMGERLRYRIEVPDELKQFAIAPMLLQPVVENAISHGLEPKVEGGDIVVSARIEGAHVCVQVSDTGVGLNDNAPAKPGGGVGLSNLRERLRSLYAGEARVELLENQPCGMTVRLMLPLNASPTSIPSAP
jgi:sensor histidine kinase YesM